MKQNNIKYEYVYFRFQLQIAYPSILSNNTFVFHASRFPVSRLPSGRVRRITPVRPRPPRGKLETQLPRSRVAKGPHNNTLRFFPFGWLEAVQSEQTYSIYSLWLNHPLEKNKSNWIISPRGLGENKKDKKYLKPPPTKWWFNKSNCSKSPR